MKITWAPRARKDFNDAIIYLKSRSPAGAERVAARILEAVRLLETFPRAAPSSRHRGLRQLVVRRTPYLVIYRVEADRVEIRAVIHAKRKRRK